MTTDTLAAAHEALRTRRLGRGARGSSRRRWRPRRAARRTRAWAGRATGCRRGARRWDSRERAYRAYRAEGDAGGAGRVAAWLASDHLEFRGDDAVARGWLERGHRLLDDVVPRARTTAGSRCTKARTR